MLGGGAGACDCLLEALDSGSGEDERCTFVEVAGAWVDGGAILYSRAMRCWGRTRLGWIEFHIQLEGARSFIRLITRLAISIGSANDNEEVHELLLLFYLDSIRHCAIFTMSFFSSISVNIL